MYVMSERCLTRVLYVAEWMNNYRLLYCMCILILITVRVVLSSHTHTHTHTHTPTHTHTHTHTQQSARPFHFFTPLTSIFESFDWQSSLQMKPCIWRRVKCETSVVDVKSNVKCSRQRCTDTWRCASPSRQRFFAVVGHCRSNLCP